MDGTKWQDRRVWLGGGALLAVVVIAASWLLVIHPKLAGTADLRSQAANTVTQNALLAAKNNRLAADQKHIGGLRTTLAKQLRALPATSGLPLFNDQLTRIATDESVTITSISVGAPTLIPVAVAPVATTADGTDSPSATPTAATPTPNPTGSAGTDAVTGSAATATQYSISVTVVTSGSVERQVSFINVLQHGTRPVLVTSTEVTRASSARAGLATVTTQFTIFTAPMSATEVAQLAGLLHGVK